VIRRQSLARLHSMAIEGPITKVINIISQAQESSPNYISQALDKVLDILRSNELFAPHVTEMRGRNDDPVTNDLVGALLLVSHSDLPLPSLRALSINYAID
jgi:high affinity cAMP-specific and IBMX-insensitive 3',5'-cyclic phosphodiesterase 8